MLDDKLSGKKIVVAGASSGIGRSVAIALSKLGSSVIIIGRNEERLKETLSEMSGSGHRMYAKDLTQIEDMQELFTDMVSDGTKIDGLVYTAGTGPIVPIKLLKRKTLEDVMSVNVYAFIEMVRQFSNKKFHNENSSIVAISSIAAVKAEKCQTVYSMSKAALNMAVEGLAWELAPKKIRINSIMPGVVNTPMAASAGQYVSGNDFISSVGNQQLLGVIQPEQIADTCAFLLSELSSCITGRAMYADAGRL